MSYNDIFFPEKNYSESALTIFQNRADTIAAIKKESFFDVVIAGGGIHGAIFARLAALNGLKTLLLERSDYASGTSSKSSKMAHGGLRYLEMFDFKQVFEGISAREDLYENACSLVRPYPFFIPVGKKDIFFKIKLGIGLYLYDLFNRDKSRKHSFNGIESCQHKNIYANPESLSGGYVYYDGIMDDTRLVIENIIAARQEGALCLNYANLDNLSHRKDNKVEVGFSDKVSDQKFKVTAGIVVNCTGPWVARMGRINQSDLSERIAFSRGVHLIFDKQWEGPALFQPLAEKGRYYFVWPHFAGTMVGTTELACEDVPQDPMPTPAEVQEIMDRIKRDLPNAGLTSDNLHYAFAGVRTLPLRGSKAKTSKISRKHIWSYRNGVLNLIGGKYTTAAWTAFEGLKKVYKLASIKHKAFDIKDRKLPGSQSLQAYADEFRAACAALGIDMAVCDSAIRRLGGRVRFLTEKDPKLELIAGKIFKAEIIYSFEVEQAETLEDLMRRRLEIEYLPGNGLDVLPEIIAFLEQFRPASDWAQQSQHYQERISNIRKILNPPLLKFVERSETI